MYVTDALKSIVYNTGKHDSFVEISKSYAEIIADVMPEKEKKKEKTSEEVIEDIRNKIMHMF